MIAVRVLPVVAAELDKLRTLPVAVLGVLGTGLAGGLISGALAAAAADLGDPVAASDVTLWTVPFVVAGLVLVGVLPVAHEYAGRQVLTSVVAVPRRGLLVAGKSAAAFVVVALTAVVTLGASMAVAAITLGLLEVPTTSDGAGPGRLLGAAAYLTVIGMFAHVVALSVRHLVPALVGVLALVLIVSPLLAGVTDLARWLPDRAAAAWFDPSTPSTTATTLVPLVWVALVGTLGSARFMTRDAQGG